MKRFLRALLTGSGILAVAASATADSLVLTARPSSTSIPVGATVTVDLELSGVTPPAGLAGFTLDLQYDPAALVLTDVAHGTALGNSLIRDEPTAHPLFLSEVSLETAQSFFDSQPGTFLLARLTFQAIAEGSSPLTFDLSTSLADKNGTSLGFSSANGTIQVDPSVDYAIATTLDSIVVSDLSGHGDTLTLSEPAPGLLQVAAPGRWFSINGGTPTEGASGDLWLAGITRITVNAEGGDDTIDVGTFTGTLPDLVIDAGPGADVVSLLSGARVTINDPDGFTLNGSTVATLLTVDADGPVDQTAASTGTGGLKKLGAGTLTLSQNNTYSGDTTVSVGTLALAHASHNNVAGSPNLLVESGAALDVTGLEDGRLDLVGGQTLKGGGTILGALGVSAGATLAPGASPGILNSGSVAFAGGSTFTVEIEGSTVGTQHDQLNVTGSVALGGATLALSGAYTPASGNTFVIISNDASDPITGTFAGLPEGATVPFNGVNLRLSYKGGDGNDVTLSASPTPTAATLAYFRVTRVGSGEVRASWGTWVEVGMLGFHVERLTASGVWERVTSQMIPTRGWDPRLHTYGFTDASVGGEPASRYRLVEVDRQGRVRVLAEAPVRLGFATKLVGTASGVSLEVQGAPGSAAVIEAAEAVTGPWRPVAALRLDGAGTTTWVLDGGYAAPTRFYRLSAPE